MSIFISLIVLIIIILLYLHVNYHLSVSDNKQIYCMDNVDKKKINTFTYFKQPIIFDYQCRITNPIKDDYSIIDCKNQHTQIMLKKEAAVKLLETTDYYSERNLVDLKQFAIYDAIFSPQNCCKTDYDYLIAKKTMHTPLRHEYAYRTFIYVNKGAIKIKLLTPRPIEASLDYDHLCNEADKTDYNDYEEKELKENNVIFIPSYWWYKIEMVEDTEVSFFRYYTVFNMIAITPVLLNAAICKMNSYKGLNKISN